VTRDDLADAMARHDVDVVLLGREANARAVAGTTRLWLAGTRAFAPGCVVVRSPSSVHVLANSDDLVPASFPVENLYGITWNPEKLLGTLAAIPGVVTAQRVAVDGMTPMMYTMLAQTMPDAEFVDATPLLTELTAKADPARSGGVRAAAEVVAAGLAAMVDALRPGVRPRTLRGVCAEAFATFGVTTPAFEAVAAPLDASMSTWLPPERILDEHDLVVLRAGALRDGWEASAARTYLVGKHVPQERPAPDEWDAIIGGCRAGVTVGSLRDRGAIVYGVGRGVEPWNDDFVLTDGTTCAVEVAHSDRVRQDVILVTANTPRSLT
jgi:Xaa-Pro aminopeptidase